MRTQIEHFFNAMSYGGQHRWLSALLLPLSSLYRQLFSALWRSKAPLRARPLPVPVIVVGNIVAGGSGKTPIVASLAHELTAQGLQVGIITRGYGGRQVTPALVSANKPAQFGDEACMLAAQTGLPVVAGQARFDCAALLCAEKKLDVILSDDGLQHASLPRQMEICVIGGRGLGNGRGLPAGALREPLARLQSVDAIVSWGALNLSAAPAGAKAVPRYAVTGHNARLKMLNDAPCFWQALEDFGAAQTAGAGFPVYALAGVAQPARFYQQLSHAGVRFTPLAVADHGILPLAQWANLAPKCYVVMTEKDAIKYRAFLPPHWQERCIVVPWRVRLPLELVAQAVKTVVQFRAKNA